MKVITKYDSFGRKHIYLRYRKPSFSFSVKRESLLKFLLLTLCGVALSGVIITMLIIFLFSSQPVIQSSQLSSSVNSVLSNIPVIGAILRVVPIRKLAHFTLYTMLGICLIFYVFTSHNYIYWFVDETHRVKLYSIWNIGLLYAMSDEFHQYFVEGRSAQFSDVAIDFVGVLFGLALILAVLKIYEKITSKEETCNG